MAVASSPLSPPVWFCCLNPDERNILVATVFSFLSSVGLGVPYDGWELLWLTVGLSREDRKTAFLEIFPCRVAELPPVEGEPIELWLFFDDGFWWQDMATVILAGGGECPEGCGRWYPP